MIETSPPLEELIHETERVLRDLERGGRGRVLLQIFSVAVTSEIEGSAFLLFFSPKVELFLPSTVKTLLLFALFNRPLVP